MDKIENSKNYILTPGPTPIPPEVAVKASLPIIHHRSREFVTIYKDVTEGLSYIFQTKREVYILTASGTGAMETAVVNLLSPEDEIIVASCGKFGDRWIKIAKKYGIKVISVSVEWGKVIKPDDIKKSLKLNPNVKAVYTTFVETSTGVANDIKAIGEIVSKTDTILVVDAISGLVGQEFRTDEWKIDVVIASSQKGFMIAPGLAFITLSDKAWKFVETSKIPKFYFDLKKYRKFYMMKETPFTAPVSLIITLQESIKLIKKRGLEKMWDNYKFLARVSRCAMKALGLSIFSEVPCEVVTAALVPLKIGDKIIKILKERYGISIAGGQEHLKGKIIRLAHMGYIDITDLLLGFACLEVALIELGVRIEKGQSIIAIEKELMTECNNY
ncbi:MAG: alanine--glyoxylate aminotransferase family protein [Endomicrobium sp.]|jgi:aspartate aminotransferase-like enzyme|nr:alanine--glyoxylate aminotransferase family protein [Endomicrobium sp.]